MKPSRICQQLFSQHYTTTNVKLVDTETTTVEESPEPKPVPEDHCSDDPQKDDTEETDFSDFEGSCHTTISTMSTPFLPVNDRNPSGMPSGYRGD